LKNPEVQKAVMNSAADAATASIKAALK